MLWEKKKNPAGMDRQREQTGTETGTDPEKEGGIGVEGPGDRNRESRPRRRGAWVDGKLAISATIYITETTFSQMVLNTITVISDFSLFHSIAFSFFKILVLTYQIDFILKWVTAFMLKSTFPERIANSSFGTAWWSL